MASKQRDALFRPSEHLSPERLEDLRCSMEITNWRRVRPFYVFMMIIEPLLIVFNDVPALRRALGQSASKMPGTGQGAGAGLAATPVFMAEDGIRVAMAYLLSHSAILVMAIVGFVIAPEAIKLMEKRSYDCTAKKWPRRYIVYTSFLLLLVLGCITGLDQLATEHITAYLANAMVVAALILIPSKVGLVMFPAGFVSLMAGVVLFQKNPAVVISHCINGAIFTVALVMISRFLYDNQLGFLAKTALLEDANTKLDELSLTDQLTGLPNRRRLEMRADREISHMKRFDNPVSLVVMDIDHFKNINDRFGHPAGDGVLRHCAAILARHVRELDMAARWGGEEFLIILSHITPDEAHEVADRIRGAIESSPFRDGDVSISFTASFGLSQINPADGQPFEAAYGRADAAMYRAKTGGRNRVEAG